MLKEKTGTTKLKFRGVVAVGSSLEEAATSFAHVVMGKERQFIVASDNSLFAINPLKGVKYFDPAAGVEHARVLTKQLDISLSSTDDDNENIKAVSCECSGCNEVILAERKLKNCPLCASELDGESFEDVEIDMPSNDELESADANEDEAVASDDADADDAGADDDGDADDDAAEADEAGDDAADDEIVEDDEAGDVEESSDEDGDIEIDDEAGADEAGDEEPMDEETAGDDCDDDDADVEIDDADLEESSDDADADDEGSDDDIELPEEDDSADEPDGDEAGDVEGDADGDEPDTAEASSEGDGLAPVEGNPAADEYFINDEGSVNIDMMNDTAPEDGDAVDVEYSSSMAGGKRWLATVNGIPVAFLAEANAGKNKEIFHTEKFGRVAKEIITASGIPALASVGFEPIVVSAPIKSLISAQVVTETASAKANYEKQAQALAKEFETSLGMASVGINRGFFADSVNPLKVKMWEELSAVGIPAPQRIIDRVFAEVAEDYNRVLIEKASELRSKSPEVRMELSKSIIGANYLSVSDVEEASEEEVEVSSAVADRIVAGQIPFSTKGIQADVETSSSTDDYKDKLKQVMNSL